jgi:hypothetical protein
MVEQLKNSQIKKAQDYLKQANYALKTGVFKWSKDYGEASFKFEQAAKVFKEIGEEKQAAEAFINFAKCSEE